MAYVDPWTGQLFGEGGVEKSLHSMNSAALPHVVNGTVIMPKLGNATAKAALGRATWKLMHTMTLRFPETASRRSASLWLCSLHNEVNKRLNKPIFDCAHLDAEYDCGCGDEPIQKATPSSNTGPMDLEEDPSKDDLTGVGMIKGGR
ncbi:hypothetical protein H0H81_007584 [Sphagnurus paluster]|uniref:Sulfhydryl oxidase n=1 Tax=Sphagnurus paluster TaxID=117069 RepID=A0A9P7FT41_9AGAR|nr:hypothetical protein H0H81_007584 [Sphagnurus paluster]